MLLSSCSAACAVTPAALPSASRIFVCFCSRWLPSPGVVARLIPQASTSASLMPTWRSDGVMRAFRFVGAYKRAAAHSRARGKTASMPALVCVYLIASDAHEPRALTPFLSQVFLTWWSRGVSRVCRGFMSRCRGRGSDGGPRTVLGKSEVRGSKGNYFPLSEVSMSLDMP